MKRLVVLLAFLLASSFAQNFLDSVEFQEMNADEQEIILKVTENEELSSFLERLDNWSVHAYIEGLWHIVIYEGEDWVSELLYDSSSSELNTDELPELLSKEQVAAHEANIVKYIFDDAEVKEIFKNPNDYDKELVYHKFQNNWSYYISRGLEDYEIEISARGEDYFRVDGITDFHVLETDRQQELDRNKAIELAYSAENIDEVFAGIDDWYSYAENYEGDFWIVDFAANGKNLITVMVDIANQVVLETKLP